MFGEARTRQWADPLYRLPRRRLSTPIATPFLAILYKPMHRTPSSHSLFAEFSQRFSWAKSLPLALGLIALPACDSDDLDETGFDRFDTDRNAEISADEFNASFTRQGDFDRFDTDRGGDIDEDEFNAATFGVFDTNRDGTISESELDAGNDFFRSGAGQRFGDFDSDRSGGLNQTEFNVATAGAGSFDRFDTDRAGTVDSDEFNTAVFGAFDRNRSGGLDRTEFDDGSRFFDVNRTF